MATTKLTQNTDPLYFCLLNAQQLIDPVALSVPANLRLHCLPAYDSIAYNILTGREVQGVRRWVMLGADN